MLESHACNWYPVSGWSGKVVPGANSTCECQHVALTKTLVRLPAATLDKMISSPTGYYLIQVQNSQGVNCGNGRVIGKYCLFSNAQHTAQFL